MNERTDPNLVKVEPRISRLPGGGVRSNRTFQRWLVPPRPLKIVVVPVRVTIQKSFMASYITKVHNDEFTISVATTGSSVVLSVN